MPLLITSASAENRKILGSIGIRPIATALAGAFAKLGSALLAASSVQRPFASRPSHHRIAVPPPSELTRPGHGSVSASRSARIGFFASVPAFVGVASVIVYPSAVVPLIDSTQTAFAVVVNDTTALRVTAVSALAR